jgi:transposase-like protein
MMENKYSEMGLLEFQRRFRTEAACEKHLYKLRWPEGFRCPRCGHDQRFDLPRRKLYQCKDCGHQTSVTADTVMHRTRTPLRKWFWAIYLVASDKRGLSALQLSKKLTVSYYVAWTMLHKIRKAMADRNQRYQLRGVIEIDESFYGGKKEGGDKRGRGTSKVPVMIEASTFEGDKGGRGIGFARMRVIEHVDGETVKAVVGEDVAAGQKIVTDGWAAYNKVLELGHEHAPAVSGSGANPGLKWVHILASNSKAFLLGTFHGIGKKHLQSYLDEFCYRFNRRRWEDQLFNRLILACANSTGVTYSELTA